MVTNAEFLETLRACSKDEAAFHQLVDLFERHTGEGEYRYRLLADHFPDGIVALVDHDLCFLLVNGQGLAANGLDARAFQGRRLAEVFGEAVAARDEPQVRAALQGEARAVEVEYEGHHYFVRTLPVRDHDDQIVAAMVVTQDITDRKQVEEQLRRQHDTFYHLIENDPFGVYVVDADFRLREVSKGSQAIFSHIRPLLGRDFAEVMRLIWAEPFASEVIARFQHTLDTGEPYAALSSIERRQDTSTLGAYDWRIERITLPDGRFGVVCYFYDLTERLLFEQKLRESEAQRALLFEQEQAARREAERAVATQRLFMGMISHELRTPLSSIKGFASSLLAPDVTFAPDEATAFIRIIDEEADKLTNLIDQLLDVVRMQSGTLSVVPVATSLPTIIEQVEPQLQTLTTGHQLHLQIEADLPDVLADEQRMGQVIINLVGNAVKFSPKGSCIILSATARDGCVQVSVADQGPGVPSAEQQAVFEPFYQLTHDTQRKPGSGLGLAICKGLVEVNGGKIWIEDRPGPGATVAFTLPLAEHRHT